MLLMGFLILDNGGNRKGVIGILLNLMMEIFFGIFNLVLFNFFIVLMVILLLLVIIVLKGNWLVNKDLIVVVLFIGVYLFCVISLFGMGSENVVNVVLYLESCLIVVGELSELVIKVIL